MPMHAGTPSAEGAHALLCVALACVMSARTFRDARARDARDATPRAREARAWVAGGVLCVFTVSYWILARGEGAAAKARAPGTAAHVAWTLAPANAMYVIAMARRGGMTRRGTAYMVSGACASAVGAITGRRSAGRMAALCAGFATTRTGEGDWRAFGIAMTWYVALRLCVEDGEEVYFVNWAGTILCETAALAMVKFGKFGKFGGAGKRAGGLASGGVETKKAR